MKANGGEVVVRALEDEGVRFTFGIPGTHNIELYDVLERSEKIRPILITDEQSAGFMADAVSRTSGSIGVANVVPGAGVTHCLSGVAEAFMDGIPIVVLTCGIRRDTGRAYQLHDVDQLAILRPITKAQLRPEKPSEIYAMVRRAFAIARSGTPGPVAVEIPADHYFLTHEMGELVYRDDTKTPAPEAAQVDEAARLLAAAKAPALYLGNGARTAAPYLRELAERLAAPVTTTIQGKGVFPEDHPLWLWPGFGPQAPPFARAIVDRSDVLLAIGCRFGEVATASYGCTPPANLIHVDINKEVFGKNFPAKLAIESDAGLFVKALLPKLGAARPREPLEVEIKAGHESVRATWRGERSEERVTPFAFFEALQAKTGPDTIYATDSGNGTFLAMEYLRLKHPGCFIGPIDFSCMGYCTPGAIGAKVANPARDVVGLAGDGALLMTGLELITAASYGIAPLLCVLRDGELGQIAQFQRMTLARDTCTVLPDYSVEALAKAVGAEFVSIQKDSEIDAGLAKALELTRGSKRPVMVDVAIDYSRKTYFTKGAVATNFWRLSFAERLRKVARLAGRKIQGALGLAAVSPRSADR
jgi:acetolactate synthase-1/2/3 large subunit